MDGSIKRTKPAINLNGSVALVQQSPWIQNMTIRDNILGGLPLDKFKYLETIRLCEMEADLAMLPAGDFTEIGLRGINLSGGQKARLSLARAVYSDKDIFLMDDPISALDASTRKLIMNNILMKKLVKKTRVLVTHAIDFIHLADKVFIMDQGKIIRSGSYEELKTSEELISLLKVNHINNEMVTKKDDDVELVKAQSSIVRKNPEDETFQDKVKAFKALSNGKTQEEGKLKQEDEDDDEAVEIEA